MKCFARIVGAFCAVAAAALFAGCTSHPSPQQTMVDDRYMMYKETYKAYKEAEERYLNLLFNIERMPEEEELWIMKREQMQELLQLRELMLQARGELDDAMKTWETHLMEVQSEVKKAQVQQYNPNFKGRDAQRTSPGQLLPGEVPNTRKR
ncbi:MAG: hypothetical protein IKZ45_08775 [Fibrobacter sp.]|jgi:hypothetical protein|nr:hypothetical protein [Fibrobacter sp.]